jgi:hypothetical protein
MGSWQFTDTNFCGLANIFVGNTPNIHGGFIDKKYISKNLKISKIVSTLRSFFRAALLARGFSIRILLFG